jgi:hypothetical protein
MLFFINGEMMLTEKEKKKTKKKQSRVSACNAEIEDSSALPSSSTAHQ